MIPEDFRQYYLQKRRMARYKGHTWSLTLEGAWHVAQSVWSKWRNEGHRSWYMDRRPGEVEWRDDTVEINNWREHYKKLTELTGPRQGHPHPNMRQFTDNPVRVEIDGVEYPSINAAHRDTGIAPMTISHRCRNPRFPNYRRLT